MAALRGGPSCGRLTADSFGEDAEVGVRDAASPASLLARAMDGRPCGVASSPALGVGKFWKALDSLQCWLMSGIGAWVSAGVLLRNLILAALVWIPNPPNCSDPVSRLCLPRGLPFGCKNAQRGEGLAEATVRVGRVDEALCGPRTPAEGRNAFYTSLRSPSASTLENDPRACMDTREQVPV